MAKGVTIERREGDPSDLAAELNLSAEARSALESATAVLLPFAARPGVDRHVFPSGTREMFHFLSEETSSDLTIEVASSDDEYREIAEHADLWVLPVMLLAQPGAADVVVGVVSNYLYEKLRTLLPGRKAELRSKVIIATSDSLVSIDYEGPAESYESVVGDAVQESLKK